MGKRKPNLTANQMEYKKQVKRLENAVRRAEKQGYKWYEEKPSFEMPKRVTKKMINELKNTKPKDLLKTAEWVDTSTGEIVPGLEHRKEKYKERAKKASETRKAKKKSGTNYEEPGGKDSGGFQADDDFPNFAKLSINNFLTHIHQFNEHAEGLLTEWLNRLIYKFGEQEVAQMLQEGAESGLIVTYKIVYNSEAMTQYMADMLDYLPDTGDIFKEEFMNAMEEYEDWDFVQ